MMNLKHVENLVRANLGLCAELVKVSKRTDELDEWLVRLNELQATLPGLIPVGLSDDLEQPDDEDDDEDEDEEDEEVESLNKQPRLLNPKVVKCEDCGKPTPNLEGRAGLCPTCYREAVDGMKPVGMGDDEDEGDEEEGGGFTMVDGFAVLDTIPDDDTLDSLGDKVLRAYCKGHKVNAGADRDVMLTALRMRRDGRGSVLVGKATPSARAGQSVTASGGVRPTAPQGGQTGAEVVAKPQTQLKPISFEGWGPAAVAQYMQRSWTLPLMEEFCRQGGFVRPRTMQEFFDKLVEAAAVYGYVGGPPHPVDVKKVRPKAESVPTSAGNVPPTDDRGLARLLAEEALARPTLTNLTHAVKRAGLTCNMGDTGAMRAALKAYLNGEVVHLPAPKPTPKPAVKPTQAEVPVKKAGGKSPVKSTATPEELKALEATGLPLIHYRVLKALRGGKPMTYKEIEQATKSPQVPNGYYAPLTSILRADKAGPPPSLGYMGLVQEEMLVENPDKRGVLMFRITGKGVAMLKKVGN